MKPAWDALVVGAGPAGAVAARVLACAGCRVQLADPAVARPKIGEALSGVAIRTLDRIGLRSLVNPPFHEAISGNMSAWGSPALAATDFIRDPHGPGWRLDRRKFETELKRAAVKGGARFLQQRLTRLVRNGMRWRVDFDNGEQAEARWLIDATGRSGVVAQRLGVERCKTTRLVALCRFGRARMGAVHDRTWIESTPRGWWYAAWLPSGAPIAVFHTSPQDAAEYVQPGAWRRALFATTHVRTMLRGAHFTGPVRGMDASSMRLARFAGPGWLACGDAAMSFDPLSGQGILCALQSGELAARAILANDQGAHGAIRDYSDQLEAIWRTYCRRLREVYGSERRWPAEPFWADWQRGGRAARVGGPWATRANRERLRAGLAVTGRGRAAD